MENASKALLIAGAILLAILIIAIGMFIYNSAQSTVNDSMTSLSTQEIDAFNNQFISYEGQQTGSNVKALIGRLVANANTYKEEAGKIPTVQVTDKVDFKDSVEKAKLKAEVNHPASEDKVKTYNENLGSIRNKIEAKHPYWVEFVYGASSIISEVLITYDTTKTTTPTP